MSKIIWIVNEYNGPQSINTRQTIFSKYLRNNGYDVYIICGSFDYKNGKNLIDSKGKFRFVDTNDAKFYVIKTSSYSKLYQRVLVSLQFQHRIWKIRKKLPRPDVIISDFAGLFGNVFLKWKRKYKTNIIYDVLDLWPEGFVEMGYIKRNSIVAKILYDMEHKSYKKANSIIFSMQGGKDYIVDKRWDIANGGDVDLNKIYYLDNGVDLDTVDKEKDFYFFDDSDLDSNKFKIVYLGSISVMNGLNVLIETAKIIKERNFNQVIFLIYGFGNQEETLKKMVQNYELDNVVFKGKLDKRFAMSVLTRSDLNVFTFKKCNLWKYGVSPNKLFMYFASGKPVLSMIKPEYDLVVNKNAGISVDNSPEIIATTIEHFINMEKEEYNLYCKNARAIANEYDYKKLINILINCIEGEK